MQKQNHQTHYRTNARNVQLKIDEAFAERVIPANDSVRLLDQTVDEMDLQPLWSTYKRLGRKPATDPVTLFKILLYANMEGIYSSRDIESACKRDINFIWLLNGAKAPNYHEIARFRARRLCRTEVLYESDGAVRWILCDAADDRRCIWHRGDRADFPSRKVQRKYEVKKRQVLLWTNRS